MSDNSQLANGNTMVSMSRFLVVRVTIIVFNHILSVVLIHFAHPLTRSSSLLFRALLLYSELVVVVRVVIVRQQCMILLSPTAPPCLPYLSHPATTNTHHHSCFCLDHSRSLESSHVLSFSCPPPSPSLLPLFACVTAVRATVVRGTTTPPSVLLFFKLVNHTTISFTSVIFLKSFFPSVSFSFII